MAGRDFTARAEIDLAAAVRNVATVKKISRGASVFAVVKADAYAHGAHELASVFLEAGASRLCVATPAEGIELRKAGIEAPVVVLNPAGPSEVDAIAEHGLIPAVGDMRTAEKFSELGKKLEKIQKIHVEADTGMGRSGFFPREITGKVRKIKTLDFLEIEGIFTHFARADEEDSSFTIEQAAVFKNILAGIESAGIAIPFKHASNSAGIMSAVQFPANAVRPGLILYGLSPFKKPAPTEPVLSLKARISNIRRLPPRHPLGYGGTYTTSRESSIATLPVGYADGYDRRLSNRARILVNGKSAPVRGRICMDRLLADVTGISVKAGDEAVLIGKQGDESVSAEELSALCGTIPNEFICRLGNRIKRVYKHPAG